MLSPSEFDCSPAAACDAHTNTHIQRLHGNWFQKLFPTVGLIFAGIPFSPLTFVALDIEVGIAVSSECAPNIFTVHTNIPLRRTFILIISDEKQHRLTQNYHLPKVDYVIEGIKGVIVHSLPAKIKTRHCVTWIHFQFSIPFAR